MAPLSHSLEVMNGLGMDQSPAEKVDSSPASALYSALMLGTSLPACEMSSQYGESQTS